MTRGPSRPASGVSPTAGVTDLSVRLLPIGEGREELIASKRRTREVLAGIAADFR